MESHVACPWCDKKVVPILKILKKTNATVKERRCSECGKLLAAYLDGEGDFLPAIRKFES